MLGKSGAVRFWCLLAALFAVVVTGFSAAGAPSPFLFAGVVAGAACALALSDPQPFPERLRQVGLAVIGVGAGSRIDAEVMETVVGAPAAVIGGVVATLAISMAAGQLLRFSPHVNGPTAIFASIAGGASGVTAVAREMNADEGIVLSIQYLRVLFVLATVPIVAPLLGATGSAESVPPGEAVGWPAIGFTAVSIAGGLLLAQVLHFSASRLVVPLLVAAGLSLGDVFASSTVPAVVLDVGYASTGLMVGLSFTKSAVRQIARLMPLALLQLVLGVVGCALVGLLFAEVAGVSQLDGYLATTPGGLPAVTAIAIGSGAGVGLVITMQLVRIFLALLLAPLVAVFVRRREDGAGH